MIRRKALFSLIGSSCACALLIGTLFKYDIVSFKKNTVDTVYLSNLKNIKDLSNLKILTPALAQRQYAKIVLDNGLEAYLISDSEARQSSAALAVECGSWNDPKEYPGMAHFCEHMLFMGTEAYPKEFEYMQYIGDHGGKVNASTWPDRTLYMFSVNSDGFLGALDRFSHFFIDPLFSTSCINRELLAVDQEHSKNIEDDNWREYMIFKEAGNPLHPNAAFSTGNAQTLGGIPQSALKTWYAQHYSANLMHLIILSPLSMEELQKQVVACFSRVPDRHLPRSLVSESLTSSQQKGHITYIQPVRDLRRLSLVWEISGGFTKDKGQKLPETIAYALGHEGESSLSGQLKRENLAEEVAVNVEWISKDEALLHIDMDLTPQGIAAKDQAITRAFEAIALLKKEGIPPAIFEEMRQLALLKYQYQERKDPFEFAFQHGHDLVDEDLATYPSATLVPQSYNPQAIKALIQQLTPQECMITLQADSSLTGISLDRKEKWMGAAYSIQEVSPQFLAALENVQPNYKIALPEANPYIPQNLDLLAAPHSAKEPALIANDDSGKAYFLQDTEYRVPQISSIIGLKSPAIDGSARSAALGDLFVKAFTDQNAEIVHYAQTAGFSVDLGFKNLKLLIEIDGFSDKAPLFLKTLFSKMKQFSINPQQFQTYREALASEYDSGDKDLPVKQAMELTSSIIFRDSPTREERLKALKTLSYEQFLKFASQMLSKGYIEGFFYGNLNEKTAQSLLSTVQEELRLKPYPVAEQKKREVLLLPNNQGPFMIVRPTSRQGNGVVLCIEEGAFTFEKRACQQILSRALSEAFFDTLRTKQQTAYFARSWDQEIEGQLMQLFAVQSSSYNPQELLARFELFIEDFVRNMQEKIPQQRFETMRAMQIQVLETPPENLAAMAQRLNLLAFDYKGDFNWYGQRIAALKDLSYDQFLNMAKEFIARSDNRRRMAILFAGQVPADKNFQYEKISKEEICDLGTYSTFR